MAFWSKWTKSSSHPVAENASEPDTKKASASSPGDVRSDAPINDPAQDLFGVTSLAQAIARSIEQADSSDGIVFAVNGPWGSGKSSAVNLVLHFLDHGAVERGELIRTTFNPWWFNGAEALTFSFFQELSASVGKSLPEQARDAMAGLGARLSAAGPLLGGLASFANPLAGAAVAGGASLVENFTKVHTTVEQEHRRLSDAIAAQDKSFLIVIDDIDRLSTDEALQVFKLVKSAGRLPKVIYLLAFDLQLAERMVSQRYPAEGVSYLEKVIQGTFDLPNPDPADLRNQLLATVEALMGSPNEEKMVRFWNVFYDVVAPTLIVPRDAVRLSNAIRVAWPSIANDVDRADFLGLQALRLFAPGVYAAVRSNPEMLTGRQPERGHNREELSVHYDHVLLGTVSDDRLKEQLKLALRRLFPRLDAIWSNTWHSDELDAQRDRLISSGIHFRTYFAFGVADDAITATESEKLLSATDQPGAIADLLREYVATPQRKRGTRAALALDELKVRAAQIPDASIPQFLSDLFSVADELDVEADEENGFGIASNELRIHWLLNVLLLGRFDLATRSSILEFAAPSSGLGWLESLASRCRRMSEKEEDKIREDDLLTDRDTAERLWSLSLERMRQAAEDGSLAGRSDLVALLYRWRDRAGVAEVRLWTDGQIDDDEFILNLASGLVQESWSHGMGGFGFLGDRVARKTEYVSMKPIAEMLDVERLRDRAANMLGSGGITAEQESSLRRFLNAKERDALDD